jgi:deazaflavin-dependent oxidoreductase (nitroreductase family)
MMESKPDPMTSAAPTGAEKAFTGTTGFKVMRTVIGATNPLMRSLLKSRFSGRMNEALLLLRFKGRRSGKWFETPVGYVRDGDTVVVVTSPTYRWWPNVVDGADVQVRAGGQWYAARARIVAPDDPAYDGLVALQVSKRGPGMLRGFGLPVDEQGRLPEEARATAPSKALIVEVRLGETITGPQG